MAIQAMMECGHCWVSWAGLAHKVDGLASRHRAPQPVRTAGARTDSHNGMRDSRNRFCLTLQPAETVFIGSRHDEKRSYCRFNIKKWIVNMNNEEQTKQMNKIIAKCWADEGFKTRLLADPAATLKAEGTDVPAGLTVMAVENTEKVFHLVIPAKPTDLSDEDLDKVAGGTLGCMICGCQVF
jgi:hypothetical protein